MSFGYAIGDVITVAQLAWNTVQNARRACGEHDELTREVLSLHVVLRRLEQEVEKPENPINDFNSGGTHREELRVIFDGCKRVLNILDQILTKYNALSEQERSGRKLWQKISFGNGKMTNLAEMRGKLTYYTSAMSLFLNMVSVGTMGRVERQMNDAGGDLKEIKVAVNDITAHLMSKSTRHEGSVLTAYAYDDRAVWKEFRRELLVDGFSSSVIRKHKGLIKAYIEELGSRGLLDEEDPNDEAAESPYCDVESIIEGDAAHDSNSQSESEAPPRPKAEAELPIRSEPPLDFNTKPEAHSKAESGHKETLLHNPIPRVDSQSKPKTDLRWIWLSNGDYEQDLAEELRASEDEYESSSTATEIDHDRSSDAREKRRGKFRPTGEDDGTDKEAEVIFSYIRPRRSRVASPRESMAPPPQPTSARTLEQQDEEATRLFHDRWHEVHDMIAPRCIELFYLSITLPPLSFDLHIRQQNLKNDIDRLHSQLQWECWTLRPWSDLMVRQQELSFDLFNMGSIIFNLPWSDQRTRFFEPFKDLRSEGKGHKTIFHGIWGMNMVVSTGARCPLCPPS